MRNSYNCFTCSVCVNPCKDKMICTGVQCVYCDKADFLKFGDSDNYCSNYKGGFISEERNEGTS